MATTFTYFPLLPTEIRLQIWALAQPRRIVKVHIEPDSRILERPLTALTNFHAYASRLLRPFYFKSLSRPPTTLAVNRESREEMLRSYVVVRDDSGPRFFYNSMRDTLWVEQHEYSDDWALLAERISKLGLQVQHLAIRDDKHRWYHQRHFAHRVREFGVEQLFLVSEKEEGMPCVRPLIQRTGKNDGSEWELYVEGVGYVEGIGHHSIIRQFKELDETAPGGLMPEVTAVERGFWEREGLGLCEMESRSVVMREAP